LGATVNKVILFSSASHSALLLSIKTQLVNYIVTIVILSVTNFRRSWEHIRVIIYTVIRDRIPITITSPTTKPNTDQLAVSPF
jgi:hypothetical protein